MDLFETGTGEKIAFFFQYTSVFVAGFVVGFVYGWELTLVIVAVSPLLAISGGFMAKVHRAVMLQIFNFNHDLLFLLKLAKSRCSL